MPVCCGNRLGMAVVVLTSSAPPACAAAEIAFPVDKGLDRGRRAPLRFHQILALIDDRQCILRPTRTHTDQDEPEGAPESTKWCIR